MGNICMSIGQRRNRKAQARESEVLVRRGLIKRKLTDGEGQRAAGSRAERQQDRKAAGQKGTAVVPILPFCHSAFLPYII